MVRRGLSLLPMLVASSLAVASVSGCAAPDEEAAETSSAFTIASGARFVVSATPTAIVLARRVDGVAFPFDERALIGKALLIHPIAGRAEEGVYARANRIVATAAHYEIESSPLTVDEMADLQEDDIVRIFMDPQSAPGSSSRSMPRLETRNVMLDPGLRTTSTAVNGFTLSGLNLQSGIDFGKPRWLRPGVSFDNTVERASFRPEILLDYSRSGLDVGFRGAIDWRSTLKIRGQVSGEFFKSPIFHAPAVAMFVPIGPFPVPVMVRASAFAFCSASVAGPTDLGVTIAASARLAGSLRFKASAREPVSQGPWASEATGTGSIVLNTGSDLKASVSCTLPRVEVHADVAGIVGPYVAGALVASADIDDGVAVAAQLSAGFGSGLAGNGFSPEIGIYSRTWKR